MRQSGLRGKKLFAISITLIGLIFLTIGNLKIREDIPSVFKVMLLIGLWGVSKLIVHKILEKKYLTV